MTALWKDGLDYRHGTGHGVGSHLNVHEGPFGIGMRVAYNEVKVRPRNGCRIHGALTRVFCSFKQVTSAQMSQVGCRVIMHRELYSDRLVSSTGYYEDGSFGIRIENMVVVKPAKTMHNFGGVQYLGMEHVTMVRKPRQLLSI